MLGPQDCKRSQQAAQKLTADGQGYTSGYLDGRVQGKGTKAFDRFLETYRDKYPKATDWEHIRTTNPVESTFATVRLRTAKTRGCVSRTTILTMVFKLGMSAQRRWRRLKGFEQLSKVITGVKFRDGVEDVPVQKSKRTPKGQAA